MEITSNVSEIEITMVVNLEEALHIRRCLGESVGGYEIYDALDKMLETVGYQDES